LNQDGEREYSDWFATVFGAANITKFMSYQERDFLSISGKMKRNKYKKQDGTNGWRQELIVYGVEKHIPKQKEIQPEVSNVQPPDNTVWDIPF